MSDSASDDSSERRKKRAKTNANEVDLSNSSRKVWLVKVPEFVKEAWSTLPASATLGTLTVLNPAEENPEISVTLKTQEGLEKIPKHFKMTTESKSGVIEIFSESANGEKAFEGIVERKGELTPILNDEYFELMQQRRSQAKLDEKKPKTLIDTEARIVGFGSNAASRHQLSTVSLGNKKVAGEHFRLPIPRVELENKILAAFERKSEYTFAELDKICDQPAKLLKDALNDMAVFVSSRRVWQLKQEYRSVDETIAPADDLAFKFDK